MSELTAMLDEFANIDPPFVHWLGSDDADASLSYCGDCAEKAVAKGEGEYVDGGWGWKETEGCCHCETCGCVLAYVLLDYGVREELAHFHKYPPSAPLTADDAFHIARIVAAAPENEEAVALAKAAIALIPAVKEVGDD